MCVCLQAAWWVCHMVRHRGALFSPLPLHSLYTPMTWWRLDKVCFGLQLYKLFVTLLKKKKKTNQEKYNRVIKTLYFSFPGSDCHRPSCLFLHSAHKSAMATGEKRHEKKGKDLTTWRTFLEKSFSWTLHSSVFADFPRTLSTLALQRGLFGHIFEHLLMRKQTIKGQQGVWWDESDNPSHKPKQSDRMEKQATLKEKVNKLKSKPYSFRRCHVACRFCICWHLIAPWITRFTSRPGQEIPNDHSCENLVKDVYRFSSHAYCLCCTLDVWALLARTIANINVIFKCQWEIIQIAK